MRFNQNRAPAECQKFSRPLTWRKADKRSLLNYSPEARLKMTFLKRRTTEKYVFSKN